MTEKTYTEKIISDQHIADTKEEMESAREWLIKLSAKRVTAMEFLRHWLGSDAEEEIEGVGVKAACGELVEDIKRMYYNTKAELKIIQAIKQGKIQLSDDRWAAAIEFQTMASNLSKRLMEKSEK